MSDLKCEGKYVNCQDCGRELSIDDACFYKGLAFCIDCIDDVSLCEDDDEPIYYVCCECREKVVKTNECDDEEYTDEELNEIIEKQK